MNTGMEKENLEREVGIYIYMLDPLVRLTMS